MFSVFENFALLLAGEENFFVSVLDFDQRKEEKIKYLLQCGVVFFCHIEK